MIDFSYLRPPADVYQIKHDPFYIKHGEGKNHVRKIFFHQEFDDYEKQKIKELVASIQQHKLALPPDWCQELTLKYCYSGGFEISKCIQRLQKHLEWINDDNYQVLSPEAEQYLKQGYIYQFGRDHQYRPVVYIQLHMISKNKLHVPTLLNAATAIGNIVTKFMYTRGYVENWIVILDSGGSGLFDFPFSTLSMINEFFSINYTSSLHKMFILNPSFFFNSSWKLIEKIIHPETAAKINFLKASDFYKLQELIPAEEIEIKYGGQHPNLVNFWPPINTKAQNNQPNDEFQYNQRPQTLTKRTQSVKESEYFSIDTVRYTQSIRLQQFQRVLQQFQNERQSIIKVEYRIHEQFQEIDQYTHFQDLSFVYNSLLQSKNLLAVKLKMLFLQNNVKQNNFFIILNIQWIEILLKEIKYAIIMKKNDQDKFINTIYRQHILQVYYRQDHLYLNPTQKQLTVRTQMERLSQNQNKKLQLQEERFTEIERENRILLEKIQNIMNNERKRASSNWQNNNMTASNFNQSQSVNRKQSLNKEKRKKELVRITIENQRLMNRLVTKKPNYNTKIILKQTSKQQQLAQQIAEYPLKRSRIQSSNRQKSPILFKCIYIIITIISSIIKESSFMGFLPTQTNFTPNNQQQRKIVLYKQNKKIDDKLYYIEVFYEDDLFKITVDDEQSPNTKVFEMPQEDGQMVLREIYNNNILQLVDAISVDNNIHLAGLEQFEQSQQ